MIELVRRHCPTLAAKIVMHETGIEIHELLALIKHLDKEGYDDGWDEGSGHSYDNGRQDGYADGYTDGLKEGKQSAADVGRPKKRQTQSFPILSRYVSPYSHWQLLA